MKLKLTIQIWMLIKKTHIKKYIKKMIALKKDKII